MYFSLKHWTTWIKASIARPLRAIKIVSLRTYTRHWQRPMGLFLIRRHLETQQWNHGGLVQHNFYIAPDLWIFTGPQIQISYGHCEATCILTCWLLTLWLTEKEWQTTWQITYRVIVCGLSDFVYRDRCINEFSRVGIFKSVLSIQISRRWVYK